MKKNQFSHSSVNYNLLQGSKSFSQLNHESAGTLKFHQQYIKDISKVNYHASSKPIFKLSFFQQYNLFFHQGQYSDDMNCFIENATKESFLEQQDLNSTKDTILSTKQPIQKVLFNNKKKEEQNKQAQPKEYDRSLQRNRKIQLSKYYIRQMSKLHNQLQTSQKNQIEQNRQFKCFYQDNNPASLVILWPLNQMPSKLIRQKRQTQFIYLQIFNQQQRKASLIYQKAKKQLEKIPKKQIKVAHNMEQLVESINQKYKDNQQLVVFTTYNLQKEEIPQNITKFYICQENRNKVSFMGSISPNIEYVNDQQEMIKKLKQHLKERHLVNFIFMNPQEIGTSNRLFRVMHSMLNQQIDKKTSERLVDQFGSLLLLMAQKSSFYYNYEISVAKFVEDLKKHQKVVEWYTSQCSLYKVLNNLLRSARHPAEIYYVQPFLKSLYLQVRRIFEEHVQKYGKRSFTCYRGAWLSQTQIQKLKKSKGEIIMNLSFMSTTRAQGFGHEFGNCYFQIQVDQETIDDNLCHGYANIEKYSSHPYESEVLFNPLNNFLVIGFDYQEDKMTLRLKYGVLSQLQTTRDKYLYCTQYGKVIMGKKDSFIKDTNMKAKIMKQIALSFNQSSKSIQCQGQGQLLIEGDTNLQGANIYWRKYFEIFQSNLEQNKKNGCQREDFLNKFSQYEFYIKKIIMNSSDYGKLAIISSKEKEILLLMQMDKSITYVKMLVNLGLAYHQIGKIAKAIRTFEQAKLICKSKFERNQPQLYSSVLANLGIAYQSKGEYDMAVQAYKQVIKLRNQKPGINDCDYAGALHNLANIYSKNEEIESAIPLYQLSTEIYKNKLGLFDTNYAKVLGDLGIAYIKKGNYEKAIKFLKQSNDIYKSKQIEDHTDNAKILLSLGTANLKIGFYQKALFYYESSSIIFQNKSHQFSIDSVKAALNHAILYYIISEFDKCLFKLSQINERLLKILKQERTLIALQLLEEAYKMLFFTYSQKNMKKESEFYKQKEIELSQELQFYFEQSQLKKKHNIFTDQWSINSTAPQLSLPTNCDEEPSTEVESEKESNSVEIFLLRFLNFLIELLITCYRIIALIPQAYDKIQIIAIFKKGISHPGDLNLQKKSQTKIFDFCTTK